MDEVFVNEEHIAGDGLQRNGLAPADPPGNDAFRNTVSALSLLLFGLNVKNTISAEEYDDYSIDDIDMPYGFWRCLRHNGIYTIGDLMRYDGDLRNMVNDLTYHELPWIEMLPYLLIAGVPAKDVIDRFSYLFGDTVLSVARNATPSTFTEKKMLHLSPALDVPLKASGLSEAACDILFKAGLTESSLLSDIFRCDESLLKRKAASAYNRDKTGADAVAEIAILLLRNGAEWFRVRRLFYLGDFVVRRMVKMDPAIAEHIVESFYFNPWPSIGPSIIPKGMTCKTCEALYAAGYHTLFDLLFLDYDSLCRIPGIDKKGRNAVIRVMRQYNLAINEPS